MESFQNDFSSSMDKWKNDYENLVNQKNILSVKSLKINKRISEINNKVQKNQLKINENEENEKLLGKREALFHRESSLPNDYVVDKIISKREEKLAKLTVDFDSVKQQLYDLNENMFYYQKNQARVLEYLEKYKEKEKKLKDNVELIENEFKNEYNDVINRIKELKEKQGEYENDIMEKNNEHLEISLNLSKQTKEYMKMDLKHQNIERAIIITNSNPKDLQRSLLRKGC